MKKFLFVGFLVFPFLVQSINELKIRCHQPLEYFIRAEQQDLLFVYETMVEIFSHTSMNSKLLLKTICKDINACRRFIRKNAKKNINLFCQDSIEYHKLLQQLLSFHEYVKENQECCEAIQFHNYLRKKYASVFNNPMIVEAIELTPHVYGVEKYKCKHRAYFNKVAADLRQIEFFEDILHADYGVLKAHNYVYKIELIRIRNHIYHDVRYQFEKRLF